jgi:hypothetical protein
MRLPTKRYQKGPDGKFRWYSREELEELWENRPVSMQLIMDLDQSGRSYQSPVSLRHIDSRTKMREDLKVTGCRQVDPTERSGFGQKPTPDYGFLDKIG